MTRKNKLIVLTPDNRATHKSLLNNLIFLQSKKCEKAAQNILWNFQHLFMRLGLKFEGRFKDLLRSFMIFQETDKEERTNLQFYYPSSGLKYDRSHMEYFVSLPR